MNERNGGSFDAVGPLDDDWPVYVSSPLGFTDAGWYWKDEKLFPQMQARRLRPLDPWRFSDGTATRDELSASENVPRRGAEVNASIAQRNRGLMERSLAVLALLDGPDIDSGVACEIGYAAAISKPVVGLRTDRRRAGDNEATPINLQVMYCLVEHGGYATEVDDALNQLVQIVSFASR